MIAFASELVQYKNDPDFQFFFHAGETKWNGMSTDLNILDAILLGAKRIGHGFAITKHPLLMEKAKNDKIAIEVNPISNQVLKLVEDLRNHPAHLLFAKNYPVVISSDDPGFWGAKALSDDFYIAFMAIASAEADLKFLKGLSRNSIKYIGSEKDKKQLEQIWNRKWNNFIYDMIRKYEL